MLAITNMSLLGYGIYRCWGHTLQRRRTRTANCPSVFGWRLFRLFAICIPLPMSIRHVSWYKQCVTINKSYLVPSMPQAFRSMPSALSSRCRFGCSSAPCNFKAHIQVLIEGSAAFQFWPSTRVADIAQPFLAGQLKDYISSM